MGNTKHDKLLLFRDFYLGICSLITIIPLIKLEEKYLNLYRFDLETATVWQGLLTLVTYFVLCSILFISIYYLIKKDYLHSDKFANFIVDRILSLKEGFNNISSFTKIIILVMLFTSSNGFSSLHLVLIWIAPFYELGNYRKKKYNKFTFITTIMVLVILILHVVLQVF